VSLDGARRWLFRWDEKLCSLLLDKVILQENMLDIWTLNNIFGASFQSNEPNVPFVRSCVK